MLERIRQPKRMEYNPVLSVYTRYSGKASQIRSSLSRVVIQRERDMDLAEECYRKNKEEQTQNPGGVMFLENGRKVKTASTAGERSGGLEDEAINISSVACLRRYDKDFGFYFG